MGHKPDEQAQAGKVLDTPCTKKVNLPSPMTAFLLFNMSSLPHSHEGAHRPKQWEWRKPKDKARRWRTYFSYCVRSMLTFCFLWQPRRNLSAYNYFFAETRKQLIDERMMAQMRGLEPSNDLGFSGLARTVAAKWKEVDAADKAKFVAMAEEDRERYKKQLAAWNGKQSTHSNARPLKETKQVGTVGSGNTKVGPLAVHQALPVAPSSQTVSISSSRVDLTAVPRVASTSTSVKDTTEALVTSMHNVVPSNERAYFQRLEECSIEPNLETLAATQNSALGQCGNADCKVNSDDCKRKELPQNKYDFPFTKKACLSEQPMGYDITLRNDYHYYCGSNDDRTQDQPHLGQETLPRQNRGEYGGGGEDLSTAALEPLSLLDEIAQSASFDSDGEESVHGNSSTGSQSPSTVDRLLSVLNKEDCELLVRRFSE